MMISTKRKARASVHAFVEQAVDKINEKYGQGSCEAILVKRYENMETVLKESPAIVNYACHLTLRISSLLR